MKMQFYETGKLNSDDNNTKTFASNFISNRQFNVRPIYYANSISKPEYTPSDGDRITWGKPTWTLLHILAEKIKPEYFSMIKADIFSNIFTICNNLPCPSCAEHATKYISALNFNIITNKEQLKDVLFRFHNEVNLRKGYRQFAKEDLNVTYSSKNTIAVINEFMIHFDKKNMSSKMTANNFHRSRAVYKLKNWFIQNLQFFNP